MCSCFKGDSLFARVFVACLVERVAVFLIFVFVYPAFASRNLIYNGRTALYAFMYVDI